MPQLEKNLWISGGYYVDFDELDQFRIIGPNNHLYCGLIDIPRHKIEINLVNASNGGSKLIINGKFLSQSLNFYYPAMDDIRTLRKLSENHRTRKNIVNSFLKIRRENFDKLVPSIIQYKKTKNENILSFKRNYAGNKWYKVIFKFSKKIKIENINKPYRGYKLISKNDKKINFQIESSTNDIIKFKLKDIFLPYDFDFSVFSKEEKTVKKFFQRTETEIEHLITWGKTSGDRFGTIFPRDWMEAADLGVHDLTQKARDYMYKVSLKNVDKRGESWHEDVIGEYKYQYEVAGHDVFDRHMIDIEPHHILGLEKASSDYLVDKECRDKTRLIARYILKQAREKDLITFKKFPPEKRTKEQEYFDSGNWRDSSWAFKKISQIIAPFDVNAVFYPESLHIIKKYQKELGLKVKDIDSLIKKWDKVKKLYLFKNGDSLSAYALALYDIQKKGKKLVYKKMAVNHLDESYLFTYGEGTPSEIESFCKRLLDKNYFCTKSGPMLIARNNKYGYTTIEYHGLVIWTKQASFVVLGLSKHLKKAIIEKWDKSLRKLIKKTLLITCKNMITTFRKLGAIPELHYDESGTPRFFIDQEEVNGIMSKVQLWSAVGARRIFRKYYELMTEDQYKIK